MAGCIKIADLVDDSDPAQRGKVLAALKDPAHKNDRDHVDIIIALGMAKEGFDWIWCEHALTVGYRSSLTEIIQIIGRATRDAPGKESATFTNLIAEPDASEAAVVGAINDTLKAIAASLLMEQVLAPRFTFTPKDTGTARRLRLRPRWLQGRRDQCRVCARPPASFTSRSRDWSSPRAMRPSASARKTSMRSSPQFVQDKTNLEQGMFNEETVPQELTQLKMGKIVRDRYPELSEEDQEAVRQHAIAALNLTQKAKEIASGLDAGKGDDEKVNTALIDGVRKFAMDVRDLDIDLIDSINPFEAAYAVLAKSMNETVLKQVQSVISAKKVKISRGCGMSSPMAAMPGTSSARRCARIGKWTVEIIKRSDKAKGFEVLPRRWVVERTLAWLNRNRRLAKDFEQTIASATAWLFIASIQLFTRRIARL